MHQSSKPAIRFEACMCIDKIVKKGVHLDYSILITKVAPIIVGLFSEFESSNVLWPLISFLTSILEKSDGKHE